MGQAPAIIERPPNGGALPDPLELLLVDDDADFRGAASAALRRAGHAVTVAATEAAALDLIDRRHFDVVVSDVSLGDGSGDEVLRQVRLRSPELPVILITGYSDVARAVAAVKDGAFDYVTKPFDLEVLSLRLAQVAERRRLRSEVVAARAALASQAAGGTQLVGRSPVMARLVSRVDTFAGSDAPVLVTGETGTGKELVARRLHERSPRHDQPFVAVNCAAFPDTLVEAELFGHEKGAFTSASKRRHGRFKAADKGTLFLDEVADMPLAAQVKLLRVLQDGVVVPLGTNDEVQVDVRVIAATHRDLKDRVARDLFREDLYYRLKVLEVSLPPLRERPGDLPLLVEHALRRATRSGGPPPTLSPRAWAALAQHPFPGNVRELEHAIEHAVVLSGGREIDLEHLPADLVAAAPAAARPHGPLRPLQTALKEFEREYLVHALSFVGGRRAEAARALGISRKNLWEKLRAQGVSDADLGAGPEEADAIGE